MSAHVQYVKRPESGEEGWEIVGEDGKARLFIGANVIKALEHFQIPSSTFALGGGSALSKAYKISGTLPLTNVGTMSSAVVTLSGMTGLATLDSVVVCPRVALAAGLGIMQAYVPAANTLNVVLGNYLSNSVASQPAIIADVFAVRAA